MHHIITTERAALNIFANRIVGEMRWGKSEWFIAKNEKENSGNKGVRVRNNGSEKKNERLKSHNTGL